METTLGAIADVVGGLAKGQKRRPDEKVRSIPYLRVANVQRGYLDLTEIKWIDATESEIVKLQLRPGDLLFTEGGDRDKLGRGWIWSGEIKECIHQNHIFRARLRDALSQPKFVSWFANHEGKKYFLDLGKQTTNLASISLGKLRELPVRMPPVTEQRRIVEKIEALTQKSRRAKDALDAIPPLLERFRQSVLASAFRGDLTKDWRAKHPDVEPADKLLSRICQERRHRWEQAELVKLKSKGKPPSDDRWKQKYEEPAEVDTDGLASLPKGWGWISLEAVADVIDPNPKHRNPPYVSIGFPFVSTAEFTDPEGLELDTSHRVSEATVLEQEARCDFSERSVLFSRKGTIGKTRLLPTGVRLGLLDSLCVVNAGPELHAPFLNYALRSPLVIEQIELAIRGVALKQVSVGRVRTLAIPVAPFQEQQQLASQVAKALSTLHSLTKATAGCRASAARLDASILAKAFRGELTSNLSND